MVEFQFIGIFLALCVSQTMADDSNFIFCPNLCDCKSTTIQCPIERLPVSTPPGPFTLLRIFNPNHRAAVIPERAFRLLGNNKQLAIRIVDANITKISAHAFDGIKNIRGIHFSGCNIGELEPNSFSNINFTFVYYYNTSIGTIRQLAYKNMNSSTFIFFKTNITRILRAAFYQVQIKRMTIYKSKIKLIESNAFGHWTNGIKSFKLKYCDLGSFECNESTNETSVGVMKTSVNCSCSELWMLRNTSNFYPMRSEFQCQGEASGSPSLAEKEDSLLTYCLNATETIDEMCSPRQVYKERIDIGPITDNSVRHVMTVSLFLFNWLIFFEINFLIH